MSGAPEPSNANSPVPSFLSTGEHDGLFLSGALDPPAHPGIFATLGGYHIVRQIGAGGMGIVFESRDPQNGGRLAIKLLRPELVGVGQAVHRFLVEARHMHELSHPHIVPVFAVEQRERGPFYVMPYMAGCSLAAKLGQPMDTAAATRIAVEIAEALVYAHVKGILHRDIKPANILLDDRGVSYLSDFGLVRTFFSDSAGGGIPAKYEGTAPYMSPNVAAGLKEDTRCDIYSFGATLYEMLTGTPPYEGRSSDEVVKKVLSGPPEPIRSKNPKASAALVKVAEACMARELRDRYAEMGDVLDDLRRAGRGEPIVGPHGAGRTVFRRTALIAAGVLAIGGMLAAAWNLNQSKAPITQRVNLPTSMPSVVATQPSLGQTSTQPGVTPFVARLATFDRSATHVQIDSPDASDADLSQLASFPHLTYLRLHGSGITDAGLMKLAGLHELRSLTLYHTSIRGPGLDALAALPNLEAIHFDDSPVDDRAIPHLGRLHGLHDLQLCDTRVTDSGMPELSKLVGLTRIDLWGLPITDRGLAKLEPLHDLRAICLRGTRVSAAGLIHLRAMPHLTWLDLRGTRLHPASNGSALLTNEEREGLPAIESLKELGHLDLCSTGVSDSDLDVLHRLPKLKELVLDDTPITDQGARSLALMTQLESLGLCRSRVTDAGLESISQLIRLQTLYLDGDAITDTGLMQLRGLSNLRTLHVQSPTVTEAGVNELQVALPSASIRR